MFDIKVSGSSHTSYATQSNEIYIFSGQKKNHPFVAIKTTKIPCIWVSVNSFVDMSNKDSLTYNICWHELCMNEFNFFLPQILRKKKFTIRGGSNGLKKTSWFTAAKKTYLLVPYLNRFHLTKTR